MPSLMPRTGIPFSALAFMGSSPAASVCPIPTHPSKARRSVDTRGLALGHAADLGQDLVDQLHAEQVVDRGVGDRLGDEAPLAEPAVGVAHALDVEPPVRV